MLAIPPIDDKDAPPSGGIVCRKLRRAAQGELETRPYKIRRRSQQRIMISAMSIVTVSSKYQMTIPREIRESLAIRPGQKLAMFQIDDRMALVRIRPIKQMRGFVKGVDTAVKGDPGE